MYKSKSKQNFIKIYNAVQELGAFSLRELDRAKCCSVKLVAVLNTSGHIMLKYITIQNFNKIYRAVQEL